MLTKRIIIRQLFAHDVKNHINAGGSGELYCRDIVTVIPNEHDLIDKFVVCKSGNIYAYLHIDTLLRNGENEIL